MLGQDRRHHQLQELHNTRLKVQAWQAAVRASALSTTPALSKMLVPCVTVST
jgi:hypothetical protein